MSVMVMDMFPFDVFDASVASVIIIHQKCEICKCKKQGISELFITGL